MMKRLYQALFFMIFGFGSGQLQAQLADGSLAPDFTLTDINGQTHNLYSYLNQGKTVFLDFFATWCGPCWNYHNSGALEGLYEEYGPNGTGEVMVIAIEADNATTMADLYGTGSNTQGNWVDGTAYPIINSASQNGAYAIAYFPTIYGICPNRQVTEVGQQSTAGLYNFVQQCPSMTPGFAEWNVTNVSCIGGSNGSITVEASGGVIPLTYQWSNGSTGPAAYSLAPGNYRCTITDALGQTAVSPFIQVAQPATPISISVATLEHEGCLGQPGSITLNVSGGWDGYQYDWNNGSTSPFIALAPEGMYSVTITDELGCQASLGGIEVLPPDVPTVVALSPSPITCFTPSIQLSGLGSSQGSQYTYTWTTTDGHIVSGANTLLPVVDEAGSYRLTVNNLNSGCTDFRDLEVTANTTVPSAAVAVTGQLNCVSDLVNLQATASSVLYSWTTTNGQIDGPSNVAQISVSNPGTYTLQVQSINNGCTAQSNHVVVENTAPPTLAPQPAVITCVQSTPTLNLGVNDPQATYSWTGPGGFSSAQAQPAVGTIGEYAAVVTGGNGCVANGSIMVTQNTTAPQLSAAGGTLTCAATAIALEASSTTAGTTIAWTAADGSTLSSPTVSQPGTYTAIATGTNGCTQQQAVSVASNTTPPALVQGTDQVLPCNNDIANLNASLANETPTSFQWTASNGGTLISGANTAQALAQGPGQYTLTATTVANGCIARDTIEVTQPQALSLALNITQVSCFGESNGAIEASAGNGSSPYEYAWSTGDTTASINTLAAGLYILTVTDAGDCLSVDSIVVAQPADLSMSLTTSSQSAFGVNDGSVSASLAGGVAPYNLLWNTGDTSESISGLAPGVYTLSITDANGCTSSQTATVNSFNCTLSTNASVTTVSCNGGGDGAIAIQFSGGSEPFTVTWTDGATGAMRNDLPAGEYSAIIVDGSNCPAALTFTVEQPALLLANASASAENSYQANDGVISANPVGGVGPYSFLWSTGDSTATVSQVPPGTYNVLITDANGCVAERSVTVEPFVCLFEVAAQASDVDCHANATGSITLLPLAGVGPYRYVWSNGASEGNLTNLAAGTYQVTATDGKNCPAELSLTIAEPEALQASLAGQTDVFCADDPAGSALVMPTGGVLPYTINWSDGQTGSMAAGLVAGAYTYSLTDANGCNTTGEVTIAATDDQAPMALAQPVSLFLDASGQATLAPASLDAGSLDNCGIASYEVDQSLFSCAQLGENIVTLTVADGAGNTHSVSTTVTVIDAMGPQLSAQPATIYLDANGQASLSPEMLSAAGQDNCSEVTLSLSQTSFDCSQLGAQTVILTGLDASGNRSIMDVAVTVADNQAPTLNCPAAIVAVNCNGVVNYELPEVADNCAVLAAPVLVSGLASGSIFPVGATVNTFSYTDAGGNEANCNFTVEVPEVLSLNLQTQDVSCPGQSDGSASVSAGGGLPGYTYLWSNSTSQATITNVPAGTYEVLVTDSRGCQVFGSVEVTAPADFALTLVSVDADVNSAGTGAIDISFNGGTAPYAYNWTLNGATVSNEEDLTGLAAGFYNLQVTDANGCIYMHTPIQVNLLTGTTDPDFLSGIQLYPNPATDYARFDFGVALDEDLRMRIYDATGRLVMQETTIKAGQLQAQLPLQSMSPGVYWVRLSGIKGHWAGKLTVVK